MTETDKPNSERTINRSRLLEKRGLPDLTDARNQMIEHLRTIKAGSEPVLRAMAEVPRHAFAPPALWRMSYADSELWGPTAFLPRPSVVARIATAVVEGKSKKVLEYATGTGYLTSVLALLVDHVDTVEHDPWQLWLSSDAFRELELSNISQKASDGRLGWPERAPFDCVVVSAAIPRMLPSFLAQLTETGSMIAPVGSYYGPHRLLRAQKSDNGTAITDLGSCFFPPLLGVWTSIEASIRFDKEATTDWSPDSAFWMNQPWANAIFAGPVEGFAGTSTEPTVAAP